MSWFALLLSALILCPAWWRVGTQADKARRQGGAVPASLLEALFHAAVGTALVLGLLSAAAALGHFGVHLANNSDLGLF